MNFEGERTTLTAGDAAYAPARTWHGIANEPDAPAEMVLIFGPPQKGRPDGRTGPTAHAAMRAIMPMTGRRHECKDVIRMVPSMVFV